MLDNVKFAISRGLHYENGVVIGVSGKPLANRRVGKYMGYQIPKVDGGFTNVYAHKLIYYLTTGDERAFSDQYEVHHINEDVTDNNPDNLEVMFEHKHASYHAQLNQRSAKITLDTAREIRNRYHAGGVSQRQLAKEYELSQQHISDIVTGKKWGSKWDW